MRDSNLLRKIQELSFAKVETEHYLDTHPDNRNAMEYYRNILSELDELMTKYQNENSAIYPEAAASESSWTWCMGVWPWQRNEDALKEEK